MMIHQMCSGQGMGMPLIALGIGYLVCVKAEEQKDKFIKQLGYWVGSVIVVMSILAVLYGIYFTICCPKMPVKCSMPSPVCPMVKK